MKALTAGYKAGLRYGVPLLVLALAFLPGLRRGQASPGIPSPGMAAVPGNYWVSECVNCPPEAGSLGLGPQSLALDAAGWAHVAYGGEVLYHTWQNASGWHSEVVDEQAAIGTAAALALDGSGFAHIGYFDAQECLLKYAFQDAAGWHIETVSDGSATIPLSLALDKSGQPHLGFAGFGLFYAARDATGWHTQAVDIPDGYFISSFSLALDSSDFAHFSYVTTSPDESDGDLKYARQDANGWQFDTVDSTSWVLPGNSMGVDSQDRPHIVYIANDEDTVVGGCPLKVASLHADQWQSETVAGGSGSCASSPALVLDGRGYAHISVAFQTKMLTGYLSYFYQDAGGWHSIAVESFGSSSSLALGPGGRPHIVYRASAWLLHVYPGPGEWRFQTVDSRLNGHFEENASLALDGEGNAHLGYLRGGPDYELRYAFQDATGWVTQTVESLGNWGTGVALALDGEGVPHLGYSHSAGLKVATLDAGEWHTQTVDSAVGNEVLLVLDGEGYPHLGYYDGWTQHLNYAFQDAGGWFTETVDTVGMYGAGASLALDSEGVPHMSYVSGSNLMFATRAADGWQVEIVDENTLDVPGTSSLAVDSSGKAHIVYSGYCDGLACYLKYASGASGSWHVETLYNLGPGTAPSLVLDREGNPHVGYRDVGLKYAYRDASGWHVHKVVAGSVGWFLSLAVDDKGVPRAAYYDGSSQDSLVYAYFRPPLVPTDFTYLPITMIAPGR